MTGDKLIKWAEEHTAGYEYDSDRIDSQDAANAEVEEILRRLRDAAPSDRKWQFRGGSPQASAIISKVQDDLQSNAGVIERREEGLQLTPEQMVQEKIGKEKLREYGLRPEQVDQKYQEAQAFRQIEGAENLEELGQIEVPQQLQERVRRKAQEVAIKQAQESRGDIFRTKAQLREIGGKNIDVRRLGKIQEFRKKTDEDVKYWIKRPKTIAKMYSVTPKEVEERIQEYRQHKIDAILGGTGDKPYKEVQRFDPRSGKMINVRRFGLSDAEINRKIEGDKERHIAANPKYGVKQLAQEYDVPLKVAQERWEPFVKVREEQLKYQARKRQTAKEGVVTKSIQKKASTGLGELTKEERALLRGKRKKDNIIPRPKGRGI